MTLRATRFNVKSNALLSVWQRVVQLPIQTTTRYVDIKTRCMQYNLTLLRVIEADSPPATRCRRRTCFNNASQGDIALRATRFNVNSNALLSVWQRVVQLPIQTTTRYADIKTRCIHGSHSATR